jgi:hypothetical protein
MTRTFQSVSNTARRACATALDEPATTAGQTAEAHAALDAHQGER